MNLPALSRRFVLYLSLTVVGLSLVLFNLPRYLEIRYVKSKIGSAMTELENVYGEYLDNKKALEMINESLVNIKSFEEIKKIIPKNVRASKKGDKITIRGWMDSKSFNEILDFVMRSSNMAISRLSVRNPNDSPFDLGGRRFEEFEVEMVIVNPEVGG